VIVRKRLLLLAALLAAGRAAAEEPRPGEPVRLAQSFSLSPDGRTLLFAWRGDVWRAPTAGGEVSRLTVHPAADGSPRFSPDGRRIAFASQRTGTTQVHLMDADGSNVRPATSHSEGASLQGWYPDGSGLLLSARRDHFWKDAERFFRLDLGTAAPMALLFDDYGGEGSVSPDGRWLAFTREGAEWWRRGYRGSMAGQIWLHDLKEGGFRRLSRGDHEERWPTWRPDSKGLWFASQETGTWNLWSMDLEGGDRRQITKFEGEGVTFPTASADGSTIVFRRLFDLWRWRPAGGGKPEPVDLRFAGEPTVDPVRRSDLAKATQAAFTDDGREIAFVAGGDVWVMDTELREPRRVTDTPEEERDPAFSPDFGTLVFVSDAGGTCDLWTATRADPAKWWWQNDAFALKRLTEDPEPESKPRFLPDGCAVAYLRLRGDLWTRDLDGSNARQVLASWDEPEYAISPDGTWVAYCVADDDFNRDVYVKRLDGTGEAVNVSRHPDNEAEPTWSPDGKALAFTGRRWDEETDVCYVWLRKQDDEKEDRDRALEKALEKMKGRAKKAGPKKEPPTEAGDKPADEKEEKAKDEDEKDQKKKDEKEKKVEVVIDVDGISDRIRRISIPDSVESALVWSPDSKQLAFQATVKGTAGLHAVEVPENLTPKLLSTLKGADPRWVKEGDQVLWLVDGVPASFALKGSKATSYPFRVRSRVAVADLHRAVFDQAWRILRDAWYDERLGNLDWDGVRRKYRDVAASSLTPEELNVVVALMMGELNGSHLGFGMESSPTWPRPAWQEVTGHLGARLDPSFPGPGVRVRDVVRKTPADQEKSRLVAGETILAVNGARTETLVSFGEAMRGPPDRDVDLLVRAEDGKERTVRIRPTTYGAVRGALYEQWVEDNRGRVDDLSGGTLGYLHVRGMNWPSFQRFEEELYKVGHGKDGLVIDVRENGGGFTTDHLLTCLTQPVHAITVPRGGGPGYPNDRMVYARWTKPIVVLCNQNSFSNAEIFAHAIKSLKRGRLVGVPTAGGVISTGGTSIMGVATLRLPMRGWFLPDGEDMERNGCVPDVVLWPEPGELPAGKDRQLEKAIELLRDDVAAHLARPHPPLRRASER
jgi:tricorn protease